jgi:hypothetical protein
MKPLNSEERKKSFLKFLALFIITTGLIVTAVFFGVQVPFKQNDRLRKQVSGFEHQKAFTEKFDVVLSDVKSSLDTINRAGVQAELADGKISEQLKGMNAMIDADSASAKRFYQNVVQNLAELQIAKKQLRDASGKDANLSQLLQQIETLKSDLNQSRTESNALRLQLMSMQPAQAQAQ